MVFLRARLRTDTRSGEWKARFFLAVRQVTPVEAAFWRSSGWIAAGFILAMAQRGLGRRRGGRALVRAGADQRVVEVHGGHRHAQQVDRGAVHRSGMDRGGP